MEPRGATSIVGRDAELGRLDAFVRDAGPGAALVLIGEPGVGKTTLWEAATEFARVRGARVLSARPGGSAAQLSFGGLIDLCDQLVEADLAALPEPQRRALEVALVRADTTAHPAPPMVIALGLLGVVRALAGHAPVVIAIDDLHWLDPPSVEALMFVARRLEATRVSFLLAGGRNPSLRWRRCSRERQSSAFGLGRCRWERCGDSCSSGWV